MRAGRADSRSQSAVLLSSRCRASWVEKQRQGEPKEGTPPSRLCPAHTPSLLRLPSLLLLHFPGGVQPSTWQLRSVPGSEFQHLIKAQGVDPFALSGDLALWREHCSLSWPALAWPSMLLFTSVQSPHPSVCFPCLFCLGQVTSDLADCWSRGLCRLGAWGWSASGEKGPHQVIWGCPRSPLHQLQPSKLPEASV